MDCDVIDRAVGLFLLRNLFDDDIVKVLRKPSLKFVVRDIAVVPNSCDKSIAHATSRRFVDTRRRTEIEESNPEHSTNLQFGHVGCGNWIELRSLVEAVLDACFHAKRPTIAFGCFPALF